MIKREGFKRNQSQFARSSKLSSGNESCSSDENSQASHEEESKVKGKGIQLRAFSNPSMKSKKKGEPNKSHDVNLQSLSLEKLNQEEEKSPLKKNIGKKSESNSNDQLKQRGSQKLILADKIEIQGEVYREIRVDLVPKIRIPVEVQAVEIPQIEEEKVMPQEIPVSEGSHGEISENDISE